MKKRFLLIAVVVALAMSLIATTALAAENAEGPKPRLTFLCKAPEDGYANAYIGGGVFVPVQVSEGDYLFRVTNSGADITSYEVLIADTLIHAGGAIPGGGHDLFTVGSPMAGLHVESMPSGRHGNASTNESQCEMVEMEQDPCDNVSGVSTVIFQGGNFPCTYNLSNEYFVETGYLKHLPYFLQDWFRNGGCDLVNRVDCDGNPIPDVPYVGPGKFSMEKQSVCYQAPKCSECP